MYYTSVGIEKGSPKRDFSWCFCIGGWACRCAQKRRFFNPNLTWTRVTPPRYSSTIWRLGGRLKTEDGEVFEEEGWCWCMVCMYRVPIHEKWYSHRDIVEKGARATHSPPTPPLCLQPHFFLFLVAPLPLFYSDFFLRSPTPLAAFFLVSHLFFIIFFSTSCFLQRTHALFRRHRRRILWSTL